MMNVETLASLYLSLARIENQRTTKLPQILGLKVTCDVEAIKKIKKHELHHLEAMVRVPFTLEPWTTPTSKPFYMTLLFERF